MGMDLAIVLVSGGMDSTVVAAIANENHKQLAFIHLTYGQKTAEKERECFDKISNHYGILENRRLVVDISFLSQIGASSLTDHNIEVSKYQGDSNIIPSSYVPFRNTHILSMAVSWGETLGAQKIYIGANEEDSPGYPDCRPVYYETFNKLIKVGTKYGTQKVETPIISMTKSQIIQKAIELKAPLELSWSCYNNTDIACGVCDSCALRLRGFRQLGLKDPIKYKDIP